MNPLESNIIKRQARLTRYSKGVYSEYRKSMQRVDDKYLGRIRRVIETMTERDKLAYQQNKKTKRAVSLRKLLAEWVAATKVILKGSMSEGYDDIYKLEKDAIKGKKVTAVDKPPRLILGATIPATVAAGGDRFLKSVNDLIKVSFSEGSDPYPAIAGTPRLRFKDGSVDSRNRAALMHIGNSVMTGASDGRKIGYLEVDKRTFKWISTLDGKTCMQCASLDQKKFEYGDDVFIWPPAHSNCRCAMVEDFDFEGKRGALEDFELKRKGDPDREDPYLVDKDTSFKKWFKTTGKDFQEEWLGPSRHKLYKEGNYSIDRFTDPRGRVYTLDDLERLND